MAAPCIYEHAHDVSILHTLTKQLPHSISLLRRIQHGIAHPSPTAKILATFPPSGPESGPTAPPPDTPWLAARVDLFRGRETQIILYSSLESSTSIQPLDPVTRSNISTDYVVSTLAASQPARDHARAQLLALLAYVKAHLRPLYLSSLDGPSRAALSSPSTDHHATPLIPAPDPLAFLIGSFHAGLYTLLLRDGVFPSPGADPGFESPIPGLKIHRYDNPPYDKFFFRTAALNQDAESHHAESVPLPAGYRYHDARGRAGVRPSHLDLVQSRTHIPRSRAQLSVMPGVAVYWDGDGKERSSGVDEEMPIAWAFLGVDGPVATLHVEPEHRGKGLGLALCKETMRRGMDADGVFGAARAGVRGDLADRMGDWVHTEVAQFNKASQSVMKKIGGEVLTTVMWAVIEVVD